MTNDITAKVERLRGLLEKATPGPWRQGAHDMSAILWAEELHRNGYAKQIATTGPKEDWRGAVQQADDAALIVAMRNDLPTLIEALSSQRAEGIEAGEAMWNGLARDIMMWLDMGDKTPRALFWHLERTGREIPQWLRDEPEMQSLDHVPSKGTRCVLIWRAMQEAALTQDAG